MPFGLGYRAARARSGLELKWCLAMLESGGKKRCVRFSADLSGLLQSRLTIENKAFATIRPRIQFVKSLRKPDIAFLAYSLERGSDLPKPTLQQPWPICRLIGVLTQITITYGFP